MSVNFTYPEIEAAPVYQELPLWAQETSKHEPPTTHVDLLEVGGMPEVKAFWKEDLDHDSLVEHLEGLHSESGNTAAAPVLRIFFVDTAEARSDNPDIPDDHRAVHRARLHPSTMDWIRDRFGVSTIFCRSLTIGATMSNMGHSSFFTRDDEGVVINIAGFYDPWSYSCLVWFSHDLEMRTSTYLILNCPTDARTVILKCALEGHAGSLGRVCTIDTFIVDELAKLLGSDVVYFRNELFKYEQMRNRLDRLSPAEISVVVEELHHISEKLHNLSQDLSELEELVDFLRDLHKQYTSYLPDFYERNSVVESLSFVASRTRRMRGWVVNFINRTDIRINLFFNLASQRDNRTNLDIADFTSKIAVDTQQDSSSMITIAAVTMFFLPGTFVSALFSMVFFDSGTDSTGRATIILGSQLWIFFAITIPLTIVVFIVWMLWQRRRNKLKAVRKTDPFSKSPISSYKEEV